MSFATWKRLVDLEAAIKSEFPNSGSTQGCPEGPRVHLVFGHYGAVPDVDKAMELWKFATLDAYGKCSENKWQRPARDFLAVHFMWVMGKKMQLDELPNRCDVVKPTADDGGTLIHFTNANFAQEKVPTKITAPVGIADWKLVDRYDTSPPPPEQPGLEGWAPRPTPPPAGGPASPAVEDGKNYPQVRTICLSVPGSTGDHKDVEVKSCGGTLTGKVSYPIPPSDGDLRLLAISPGFKWSVKGKEVIIADPWAASTYNPTVVTPEGELKEESTGYVVGSFVRYMKWHGLQRTTHAPNATTTSALAETYKDQIKDSRATVFKALRDIEGACETVTTYDGPKLSWGINQWIGGGELWQILAFIWDFFPEAFARRFGYFGMGVWFSSRAATFNPRATYRDVVIYRVPCCGQKTRDGIEAIYKGAKDQADADAKGPALTDAQKKDADDKPPKGQKQMAQALAWKREDSTSFASAFMFSTAGADPEIQKAMAQWMSYRISSVEPVGKTLEEVVNLFLKSLGSNISPEERLTKAIASLKSDLGSEAAVKTALAGTFSDTGADEDWIDWQKRCANAGKSTQAVAARGSTKNRTKRSAKSRKPS